MRNVFDLKEQVGIGRSQKATSDFFPGTARRQKNPEYSSVVNEYMIEPSTIFFFYITS